MKRKHIFQLLFIFGFGVISVLAFEIPNNPNKIIYSITGNIPNFPLWFVIILLGTFFYSTILYTIYDKLENKNN